ncbi:MAG: glycoside hydrolase family 32 protein [Eubacteriales bacterium]|nr:glycoside hydrolase family 32 protein [Eubacteriales bacterium]
MNALYRDLNRLVRRIEAEDRAKVDADPRRLRFHLMPPVGWMNDPNGLCWYKGNYHVFYQYGPFDPDGGVKFWGHWTSPDMLHWTQQPVPLCPDQQWNLHGVYSGSALVEDDALYLYYTGSVKFAGDYDFINNGRASSTALAVTTDGIHVDSNQVLLENKDYPADLSCHVRDPKVWKQDGRYYMVLGARTKDSVGEVLVYESQDKLNWTHINTIKTPEPFGYMWECPDLFCVDGQYILSVSPQGVSRQGNRYQNIYTCGYFPLYGDFRGEYTLGDYIESDVGFDYYAPQSFEAPDGRRIVIGWMGMPDADYTNPTAAENGWQHGMSVPREIHWNGTRITALPVQELDALHTNHRSFSVEGTAVKLELDNGADIQITNEGKELRVAFGEDAAVVWTDGLLTLSLGERCGYGRTTRVAEVEKLVDMRILMDTSSLEIFINGGEQVMTTRFYPKQADSLTLEGVCKAEVYDMDAIQLDYMK